MSLRVATNKSSIVLIDMANSWRLGADDCFHNVLLRCLFPSFTCLFMLPCRHRLLAISSRERKQTACRQAIENRDGSSASPMVPLVSLTPHLPEKASAGYHVARAACRRRRLWASVQPTRPARTVPAHRARARTPSPGERSRGESVTRRSLCASPARDQGGSSSTTTSTTPSRPEGP
jgi:hypothetical protein